MNPYGAPAADWLDHIPRQSAEQAACRRDAALRAALLSIAKRTAPVPAERVVLSNLTPED